MGGCELGKGNSSSMAEFNFHADPEAAREVVAAFRPERVQVQGPDPSPTPVSPKVTMVTWECTFDHCLSRDCYDKLVPPQNASPKGDFLAKLCGKLVQVCCRAACHDSARLISVDSKTDIVHLKLGRTNLNQGNDQSVHPACACDAARRGRRHKSLGSCPVTPTLPRCSRTRPS